MAEKLVCAVCGEPEGGLHDLEFCGQNRGRVVSAEVERERARREELASRIGRGFDCCHSAEAAEQQLVRVREWAEGYAENPYEAVPYTSGYSHAARTVLSLLNPKQEPEQHGLSEGPRADESPDTGAVSVHSGDSQTPQPSDSEPLAESVSEQEPGGEEKRCSCVIVGDTEWGGVMRDRDDYCPIHGENG